MKQTTLEDLFYGNINPCEISFVRDSEYGKCFDKATELSMVSKNFRHSRQNDVFIMDFLI